MSATSSFGRSMSRTRCLLRHHAVPRSPPRAGRPPSGRQPPPGGRTRGRRIAPPGTRGAGELAGRPGPTERSKNEPYPSRWIARCTFSARGSSLSARRSRTPPLHLSYHNRTTEPRITRAPLRRAAEISVQISENETIMSRRDAADDAAPPRRPRRCRARPAPPVAPPAGPPVRSRQGAALGRR
jgi:hypothetical protein